MCVYVEEFADPSDAAGGREYLYVEALADSFAVVGGGGTCIYVEAFADPSDVWGEDACVFSWKRSRIPPIWGRRAHVCERGSVSEFLLIKHAVLAYERNFFF